MLPIYAITLATADRSLAETGMQKVPSGHVSSPSATAAQTLSEEVVLDALKMILLGAPLAKVITSVGRLTEAQSPGMLCSIFLLEADGVHLRYGAGPSLPKSYRAATDGMASGPNAGSCGTAVHLRQAVFVPDILSDPLWVAFRDFAAPAGLRAAWSSPIISNDGECSGPWRVLP